MNVFSRVARAVGPGERDAELVALEREMGQRKKEVRAVFPCCVSVPCISDVCQCCVSVRCVSAVSVLCVSILCRFLRNRQTDACSRVLAGRRVGGKGEGARGADSWPQATVTPPSILRCFLRYGHIPCPATRSCPRGYDATLASYSTTRFS
eukprot:2046467-Rhodomonas_salina.1